MIEKFYIFAWAMLVGSILGTIATGALNGLAVVSFSFIGLALIYAYVLWWVNENTRRFSTTKRSFEDEISSN
jgi:hypothetical protein